MQLTEYLEKTEKFKSAHDFAIKSGLSVPVISRFLNGERWLKPESIEKIIKATDGQVTFDDLLQEKRERQAARKNGNGRAVREIVEPGI